MAEVHKHRAHQSIKLATVLNIGFTIIEFVGGALTNSLAVMTDALHDLGDSLVLISSWKIEKVAMRKPDWKRTYGYRRMSLLAAFLNAVVILGGSLTILFQVIGRLIDPQPVRTAGLIGIAVIGILANTIGSLQLRRGETANERVLSWHLFEDVVGWIGVLIAGIAMHFTNLYILDPLASIALLGLVFWGIWRNSRELFNIFLEGAPSHLSLLTIAQAVEKVEGVRHISDIHLWSLDGKHHLFSLKAVIESRANREAIERKLRDILDKHAVGHATIELDTKTDTSEQEQKFIHGS